MACGRTLKWLEHEHHCLALHNMTIVEACKQQHQLTVHTMAMYQCAAAHMDEAEQGGGGGGGGR